MIQPIRAHLLMFRQERRRLQKIWEPYRVFTKEGELPFLIPVHGQKVSVEYVVKIEAFFREEDRDA